MKEKKYGLLGRTLGHSWSVPIHQALGCANYQLFEKEPEELAAFLRQEDLGGLNVTIPYKRAVLPFCDVIDDAAQAIGAVNTLVRREDGKLYAWNTDAVGFCDMAQRAGIDFSGAKAVILGSGGASLTAQAMAKKLGAREVVVISRSGENNYQNLSKNADAEIVVNATPVGMYPRVGVSPVDLRAFPNCRGVLDVIYNPCRTALLMQAEELGLPSSNGLAMLVAQAVAAEEHFFDHTFPSSENERILALLHREMTNLVLIGMPGCGKTTVGQALGTLTGREAIDLDDVIAARAGCSIPEIFASGGEEAFRALEREETARVGALSGKIILTGGGVVKDERNYAPLHQNGRIYELKRPLKLLSTQGRPLSENSDLAIMSTERAPLYECFQDTAIGNTGTAEETAAAIWRDFCEYFGS